MKKLISLFVVIAIICCMTMTAFADAPSVTAAITPAEVTVGTETAEVNLKVTFEEAGDLAMVGMTVVVPEGLALTDVDYSEFTSKCEKVTNDCVFEDGLVVVYDDDMEVAFAKNESVNFKFKFTITDPSVAAVYDISFEDVAFQNYDEDILVGDIDATTITVKAAEIEKEPTVNTIAATEDIEVAGTKYLGTAVYEANFDLANVIDTEKDYGIKVDGEKFEIAIGGNGGVDVVLAFYGITGDAPVVQSFWTAK